MHNLAAANDDVGAIEYHVWWPSSGDPFYQHNTSDAQGRTSYYSVTGTPNLRVDGRFPTSPSGLPGQYNIRKNAPSPIDLTITGSYDTNTQQGTITVTGTNSEALPDDDYVIRIAITESAIYYNTNYNDNHYHIMRDMLPNHAGTPVDFSGVVPVTQQVTFDFTIPTNAPPNNGYVEENVQIVALIQPVSRHTPTWAEVEQGAVVDLLELDATNTPESAALRFGFEASYPNPFNPVTTIPVRVEKSGSAILEVLDVNGRVVSVLYEGALSAGLREFQWNGTDANGTPVASGVYMARLIGATETHSQRLVLLK